MELKEKEREKIIKYLEEQLKELPEGEKIKLSNETLLNLFFKKDVKAYGKREYRQTRVESFFDKLDVSYLIISYYEHLPICEYGKQIRFSINTFLGANLENCNITFEVLSELFLANYRYLVEDLRDANVYENYKTIKEINLSNNNFSGKSWDLEKFLSSTVRQVYLYVKEKHQKEISELNATMESEFYNYGEVLADDSSLYRTIDKEVIEIIKILVPNLKNTGLNITYDIKKLRFDLLDYPHIETIIIELLESGKFDGCFINSDAISYDSEKIKIKKAQAYQKQQEEIRKKQESQYKKDVNTIMNEIDKTLARRKTKS